MIGSTILARLVRPSILLVAGMLLAQGVASTPAPAATTQTRIASCAGFNFQPIDSRTVYRWDGRIVWRAGQGGDGWFLCNASLPNKAVVTKVRFTVKDGHDLQDIRNCALIRVPLSNASGEIQPLAVVAGTGMAEQPGIVRPSDSTIDFATVDNGAFGYSLQCEIAWAPGLIAPGGAYAGIIGADVTYRISSANG